LSADKKYKAIVIGTSAGGLFALSKLLEKLPAGYHVPVLIVQHRAKDQKELLEELLQSKCEIKIKQADEKEELQAGCVYIAPPNYHLLVERDETLSLSSDNLVRYSRPSIDVLFQSAAPVFKDKLVAIILTGASNDGSAGIETVSKYGGLTIAQSPDEANFPFMPRAAIQTKKITHIFTLAEIQNFLLKNVD
jgi:two-component system, chemotaxis family, protein-glutamate methylesterase/glutaminase